ncbi:prolyl oligopeptidase family serine peptidase [Phytohabitans sp. ZYX-F-186]|uniref:Prolyl oligopeptidase family serine peptidase n=1 Tax=Phytohabitans maris TaxID=3071409 RepID=A0ABU0ZVU6_9ACTN|nr:prolyl oligopeptidase family serine peptidase [Phytohabitans sp. ZYX-F-186]MDQ7911148.1 prolyl oligopeptidase family serine peptidase [Phytohabitans sp. ZYX-F-186]
MLTAEQVAEAGTSFDWLTATDGVLYWVESSPQLGRAIVMSWQLVHGSAAVRRSDVDAASVGSSLHAYGGRPYAVVPSGIAVVDASNGQITGDAVRTNTKHVHGDLDGSAAELLGVREDDRGDELVSIGLATTASRTLRSTDGFLASPRAKADRLAWVQWDRDVMPWDSCEVWVADWRPGGRLGEPVRVAGGTGESAFQPTWGQDGSLYFMSDRSGWWNLYRWHDGNVEPVAPMEAECAAAPWESGYANYVLLPGGRIGMTVQRGPRHGLVVVEPGGEVRPIDVPYTFIKPFLAAVGDRIALICASPTRSQEIALVATDGSNEVEVIRRAASKQRPVAVPEVIRIGSGGEVTVLFYPPAGGSGPAPLIVRAHSGPTYGMDYRLDWEVQFFTARGFGVADVDYHGSTGYGREFRTALDGRWGTVDVEDCRNTALHLLATGRARADAVFICGASAGGYTALRAVREDGPFALAVARSAIVDPNRWTTTAPRFQRPHATILTHDDAKIVPQQIRRPVLLIHGDRDEIAPIEDAVELASALASGRLLRLDGVGHYLSGAALAAALDAELGAYMKVLSDCAE